MDERWSSRLFLLHYAFDTGASFGGLPPGASRHFAGEAMFVLDFVPRDGWETWLLASVALPGAAGRAVQGDRATAEPIWSVKHSF